MQHIDYFEYVIGYGTKNFIENKFHFVTLDEFEIYFYYEIWSMHEYTYR